MAKTKRGSATSVAQDLFAPLGERFDASAEVTKSSLNNILFPREELLPVINHIQNEMADNAMHKALAKPNLVLMPPKHRGERGVQSVVLDEFNITAQGNYWDRPGLLGFDSLRAMVDQTPILQAIIMTRQRQVMRFCKPQKDTSDTGFVIEHVDKNVELNDEQQESVKLLQQFIMNCGWEFNPRRRKRLKRDSFSQFMAKSVRDSLTFDAAPIETEFKRDRALGLDGFYAIDGGTIRLCTEQGYEGDDEIFALQVIQGRIRTPYTYQDLIYEVRNPRTDVMACGYGISETETLIKVVTYLLNTMTFNGSFFDKNSIPRGILHLSGNYSNEDIAAFKRYWSSMMRGATNAFNLPIMFSKDQESRAEFSEVGGQMDEMAFGKWMSFLTSIACAVYGIAPEEVAMESFTTGKSSLSGDDTEEKITSSNDKGLRPLLSYYSSTISDFIIQEFSPQYQLSFKGLDGESAAQRFELKKIALTFNEARAEAGYDPVKGDLGDAPIEAGLLSAWQAERQMDQQQKMQDQQQEQDFGTPQDGVGQDDGFGSPPGDGDDDFMDGDGPDGQPAGGDAEDEEDSDPEGMEKALGLEPVFRVKV